MHKKPTLSKYGKCRSGQFVPKFPAKYAGDPNNIIFRSNLEHRFYKIFDESPKVVLWGSEEFVIPYRTILDEDASKVRRYFPDLIIKVKQNSGVTKTYVIEIKPKSQCSPPKQRRKTARYIEEMQTWQLNQDKWKAAIEYCNKRGMTFWVLHEDHLKNI